MQGAFTGGRLYRSIGYRMIGLMRRTDVYLKVEVVVDEKEPVERIAAEICRQIRKLHGVRQAEVSSIVERE